MTVHPTILATIDAQNRLVKAIDTIAQQTPTPAGDWTRRVLTRWGVWALFNPLLWLEP